jgi:hypothetical protein
LLAAHGLIPKTRERPTFGLSDRIDVGPAPGESITGKPNWTFPSLTNEGLIPSAASGALSKEDFRDKRNSTLDGLHALAIQSLPGAPGLGGGARVVLACEVEAGRRIPDTEPQESWPDILSKDQEAKQTARWRRDMAEVLDAIPPPAQLNVMTDYYFHKVQGMRAYLASPRRVRRGDSI